MSSVSIVIPTYNRCHRLAAAIASAQRATALLPGSEIIVVDDASTDDTGGMLRARAGEIRSTVMEVRQGACAARNMGLTQARARYVKFLDSDDVLEPASLPEEIRRAEETGADIVASGWGCRRLRDDGSIDEASIRTWGAPELQPTIDCLLSGAAVPTSAALYERGLAQRTKWSLALPKLQDWDFFCRAALSARTIVRSQCLSYWWQEHSGARISEEASLATNARAHHAILDAMRESLNGRGELTPARRARLAQYYYKELSILCRFDRSAFERAVRRISDLDVHFSPSEEEPRLHMRVLARVLGFRRAVIAHTWMRRRLRGP